MFNADLLKIMNSAFALIYTLIPERESYNELYEHTVMLLRQIVDSTDPYNEYLKWEINLLGNLGYGLDLTKCSGCQKTENLCYLSPKTGRAVCADCGEPYRDKLYKLPVSLGVTGMFINHICNIQGVEVPTARKIF